MRKSISKILSIVLSCALAVNFTACANTKSNKEENSISKVITNEQLNQR